jgi:hypothetical protein
MPKPATPLRYRDQANPFAHIDARIQAEKDAKAAAALAKRKSDQAASRQEVKTKSWMDYPVNAMRSVGDYMRGVKK